MPADLIMVSPGLLGRSLRHRNDGDEGAVFGFRAVLDAAVDERKERMVHTYADVVARMPLRATLTYEDIAGATGFAAKELHAQALAGRVTAVARRSACFLVCHFRESVFEVFITCFGDEIITGLRDFSSSVRAGFGSRFGVGRRLFLLLPLRPRRRRRRGLLALGQDLGDPHQGIFLPVAALAPRVLASALLERDDLRAAALLEHLAGNGRTRDRRAAKRWRIAAHHQHLAELDYVSGVAGDSCDLQLVFEGDAILLAPRLDDREHRFHPRVRSRCSEDSGPAFWQSGWVDSLGRQDRLDPGRSNAYTGPKGPCCAVLIAPEP